MTPEYLLSIASVAFAWAIVAVGILGVTALFLFVVVSLMDVIYRRCRMAEEFLRFLEWRKKQGVDISKVIR